MFLDRVVHFGEYVGEQVKGRPTRKLKSLIEVPYLTRLKGQDLGFNVGKFGRSGKGSFTEKSKIVDEGSQCSALESAGCKLESEPCLFSVECS